MIPRLTMHRQVWQNLSRNVRFTTPSKLPILSNRHPRSFQLQGGAIDRLQSPMLHIRCQKLQQAKVRQTCKIKFLRSRLLNVLRRPLWHILIRKGGSQQVPQTHAALNQPLPWRREHLMTKKVSLSPLLQLPITNDAMHIGDYTASSHIQMSGL